MKLEKGYNFGDAITDNVHTQELGLPNQEKSDSASVISTSLFKEIQSKEKIVFIYQCKRETRFFCQCHLRQCKTSQRQGVGEVEGERGAGGQLQQL